MSKHQNTELCVMIKYYPLFILRSCLILISAISKHSEEVQDRCELWIIKISHFLTGLIVWSAPAQREEHLEDPDNWRGRESAQTCLHVPHATSQDQSQSAGLAEGQYPGGGQEQGWWWLKKLIYRILMSTKTNPTKSDFWSNPLRSKTVR